jgi:hypothetical protein
MPKPATIWTRHSQALFATVSRPLIHRKQFTMR